jgi:glycosyltransferase involved in cell wall biosynthesis
VHAHSLGVYALGAIESGAPTVISIHGVIGKEIALERGIKNRIRYVPRMYVVNKSLALGRDFVIVSPYIESEYARELRGKRTHTLETSVDPRFFEAEPREEGMTVLQAGPLIPRKGAIDLLRAAPQIVAAHPHVRFAFAGAATNIAYKAELDRFVQSMSLASRVVFLGRLAPDALAAEMAKSACVVLPSLQETAPIAIQEAMAAARPVVASNVGGNPYLVEEGVTGFIVPPRDPNALATRVIDLLGDPERRGAMGRRAREQARERFDMRAVAQRTVAIYDEVLASIRKAAG